MITRIRRRAEEEITGRTILLVEIIRREEGVITGRTISLVETRNSKEGEEEMIIQGTTF